MKGAVWTSPGMPRGVTSASCVGYSYTWVVGAQWGSYRGLLFIWVCIVCLWGHTEVPLGVYTIMPIIYIYIYYIHVFISLYLFMYIASYLVIELAVLHTSLRQAPANADVLAAAAGQGFSDVRKLAARGWQSHR